MFWIIKISNFRSDLINILSTNLHCVAHAIMPRIILFFFFSSRIAMTTRKEKPMDTCIDGVHNV